jgi:hypothetical protein
VRVVVVMIIMVVVVMIVVMVVAVVVMRMAVVDIDHAAFVHVAARCKGRERREQEQGTYCRSRHGSRG